MKSLRRTLMLAGALCASLAAGAAWAADNKVVIGDIDDMSGPYADVIGPSRRRGDQDGDRRFRRNCARQADRGSDRSIIKTSRTLGAEKLREWADTRRHDDAARRVQLRRQHRDVGRGQGEEDPVLRHRRGRRVADRQGLHPLHHSLRLRHDRARQRHRQNDPRRGRQELVLPYCGLRFREAIEKPGPPKSSRQAEGSVVGDVRVPLGTSDFSSFLLQAQGSGAKVLASPTPAPTRKTHSRLRRSSA